MTPALAVVSALKKYASEQEVEYEFVWVGHKYNQHGNKNPSAEYNSITNMGIKFINLTAGKLTRNWGGDNWQAGLINFIKIPIGFIQSAWIILKYRPRLIMSFGGYLALPISIVGKILGRKVVTHEQTAVTGLTNRIIPKFADKILISWPSSAKYYPAHKTVLTGNPLRPEIFEVSSQSFELNSNLPTIYLTAGNQGSHKLNEAIFPKLDQILDRANFIHQTGNSSVTGDFEKAKLLEQEYQGKYKAGEVKGIYHVRDFVYSTEVGEAFGKADLIIARAGANTTYEILALSKPAIFVPIPWVTHNEQFKNASLAKETGIGEIINEQDLTSELLLERILNAIDLNSQGKSISGTPLEEAKQQAKAVVKLDAANLIVRELIPYL